MLFDISYNILYYTNYNIPTIILINDYFNISIAILIVLDFRLMLYE